MHQVDAVKNEVADLTKRLDARDKERREQVDPLHGAVVVAAPTLPGSFTMAATSHFPVAGR